MRAGHGREPWKVSSLWEQLLGGHNHELCFVAVEFSRFVDIQALMTGS